MFFAPLLSKPQNRNILIRIGVDSFGPNCLDIDSFWKKAERTATLTRLAEGGHNYATGSFIKTLKKKNKKKRNFKMIKHKYLRSRFSEIWEIMDPEQKIEPKPPKRIKEPDKITNGGVFLFDS